MAFPIKQEKVSTLLDLASIFSSFWTWSLDENFTSYKNLVDKELNSFEICENMSNNDCIKFDSWTLIFRNSIAN